MGKRIISQNRGKGSPTYRAPSHRYRADIKHIKVDQQETIKGVIQEIMRDPARSAPVALVVLSTGEGRYILVSEAFM